MFGISCTFLMYHFIFIRMEWSCPLFRYPISNPIMFVSCEILGSLNMVLFAFSYIEIKNSSLHTNDNTACIFISLSKSKKGALAAIVQYHCLRC